MASSQFANIRTAYRNAAILKRGSYRTPSGQKANLSQHLQMALGGTMEFLAGDAIPPHAPGDDTAEISVVNRTSLAAAKELYDHGLSPVVLNFANARQPGGGYWLGAGAQEESLCRASGLYPCLLKRDFYRQHRMNRSSLYTDHLIYSPGVPVFRNDIGALLEEPWPANFITSAAPNATIMRLTGEFDAGKVAAAFESRIRKVLAVGASMKRPSIVLGAWGCGAFGNDPGMVAGVFSRVIREEFTNSYRKIVFAVLDRSAGQKRISAFDRALAGDSE